MANNMMPHSKETEALLVGGCLAFENWFEEAVYIIDSRDFYDPMLGKIWAAMAKLYSENKRFDFASIAQIIDARAMDEIIKNHLIPLSIEGPKHMGSWNVVEYAEKIRELSERRRLIVAGQEISKIARLGEYGSNRELFDQAERVLANAAPENKKGQGLISLSELALPYFENLEKLYAANKTQQADGKIGGPVTGIPTGWRDLDAYLCGHQEGDLEIVAARPSVGKTAYILNAGRNVAIQENTYFALFSLEMDRDRALMNRIIASSANVDLHMLRSGIWEDEDWPKLTMAVSTLPERFLVDDTPGMTLTYIKREIRRLRRKIGSEAKLVVGIDYLQRISAPRNAYRSRFDFVTEVVMELKEAARENRATVIALSQLSRDVEKRADKRPMLSDLRESGQIEQEADVIQLLYRDDYYNKNSEKPNIMEVIIAKNRNAPTGVVELVYLKNYQKFLDLERRVG
jgi:replicative DNA helicase